MSDIERYSPDHTHATMKWSEAMSTGDLLPAQYRGKPANLMFAAEYADSLGISRVHVLTSIAVINGRPSPSADLMAAMVRSHGHKLRITGDDTHARAELIRSDDPDFSFVAEWDQAKAAKAKLWGNKGPWSQYPAAMLRARAISEVVRMGAQDVMAGGIYTPEELGAAVDADGVPVESERVQHPTAATRAPQSGARSNHDAAMQALGGQAEPVELSDGQMSDYMERIEQSTDKDELRALYNEVKGNDQTDILHDLIVGRVADLDQQTTDDTPAAETVRDVLDAELVEDGGAA